MIRDFMEKALDIAHEVRREKVPITTYLDLIVKIYIMIVSDSHESYKAERSTIIDEILAFRGKAKNIDKAVVKKGYKNWLEHVEDDPVSLAKAVWLRHLIGLDGVNDKARYALLRMEFKRYIKDKLDKDNIYGEELKELAEVISILSRTEYTDVIGEYDYGKLCETLEVLRGYTEGNYKLGYLPEPSEQEVKKILRDEWAWLPIRR